MQYIGGCFEGARAKGRGLACLLVMFYMILGPCTNSHRRGVNLDPIIDGSLLREVERYNTTRVPARVSRT
jgi:hypothetical protein